MPELQGVTSLCVDADAYEWGVDVGVGHSHCAHHGAMGVLGS